ncbi:uncharacterized protein LOC112563696 [Pomacea canaliculata]|uniref:uncharacterized protein LOC112563696 n=1 Tax=Pomacea canaliculata TaxID=400727 RepID=UPI000D73456A|nr:uncharacterized protein LOC112563696 [Pomacea canaliculata]
MIDTTTPSESVILRSRQNNLTDGNFHTLKIKYSDSTTYPELDGKDGAFTIEKGTPRLLTGMADGVVAGAFVTSQHGFEKSNYRPLIGCLQKLEIDNKPLSKEQADHAIGVFVGTCHQERVWSSCVHFDLNNKGIDLGTFDKSDIVAVLFSPNARGPLLSYTREEKFQAEISSTESGLHISTGDKDVTLKRPDGITEPLSLLTITDDGKNVRYKAWGESKETNYAGFWSIASDINGPHQVTVGPDVNDPQHSLVGDVAQLVIGNRYINLANYAHINDLQPCQRPLPDLVMPEATNAKLPALVGF